MEDINRVSIYSRFTIAEIITDILMLFSSAILCLTHSVYWIIVVAPIVVLFIFDLFSRITHRQYLKISAGRIDIKQFLRHNRSYTYSIDDEFAIIHHKFAICTLERIISPKNQMIEKIVIYDTYSHSLGYIHSTIESFQKQMSKNASGQ